MKNMKRAIALALALLLALSLAITAFADEATYTLTLNGAFEGHTYTAYQIFSGDLSEDGKLSNVVWGTGVSAAGQTALGDAATKAESLESVEAAEAFAAAVAPYLETAAGSATVAKDETSCQITGLTAGYYLIQTTATPEENGVYTYYIMKVTHDLQADIKASLPEIKKEVDKTDINIGDTVTFTLTATMPSSLQGYETYSLTFHDTLSAGLTYNDDAVVDVEGFTITHSVDETTGITTITATCEDVLVKEVEANDEITITYTATLNEKAVIGAEGNPNEVYLEYSNNPNWDHNSTEPTGKTPEEEVKVYTWDMSVLKYADSDETQVLEGVKFVLLNTDKNKIAKVENGKLVSWDAFTEDTEVADYELTTDAKGEIHIDGLASGTYYLRETQELEGYNKLDGDVEVNVEGKTDGTYVTFIAKVNNQSGTTLPSTGGVGTTLFYVFGAILMVGAAVLLITKRRMSIAE